MYTVNLMSACTTCDHLKNKTKKESNKTKYSCGSHPGIGCIVPNSEKYINEKSTVWQGK